MKLGMAMGWLRLVILWLGLNGIELGYKSNINQQKHTRINDIVLGCVWKCSTPPPAMAKENSDVNDDQPPDFGLL